VSIVTNRTHITPWAAFAGPKGGVCPQPVTIATRLRFGPNAASVGVAVLDGGQDGRQAFAEDRREGPT
jgi:hypothetical protein